MIRRAVHGAIGLLKSLLGLDKSPQEIIEQRWKTCESCESYKSWLCQECGCIIHHKIRVLSEECPLGKWKK
mgnify:CR=1 FL=1